MNSQDFFRYASGATIALNGATGMYVFESGWENVGINGGLSLFLLMFTVFLVMAGWLYVFGHALISGRTKWAIGIFFLGPIVQLCYWLFYIYPEGREKTHFDVEDEVAAHRREQRSNYNGGWTTPPPPREKRQLPKARPLPTQNKPQPSRGLKPPAFVDLRG